MKRLTVVSVFGLLIVLLFVASVAAQTDTVHHTMTPIITHPSQGEVREVEGGHAELFTSEAGITMNFRTTGLQEGHVYTAWWVIVNSPENCEANPCMPPDFLGNPDGVDAEITYADGILTGADGRMEFAGSLAAGETIPEGWFGNGLTNPTGAEILVVIQDHGTVIPEMVGAMLNTLRAACTDESVPAPYPDVAKADGEPGPNACALVQVAHFQQ